MRKILFIILLIVTGENYSQQGQKPSIPEPERIRTYDVIHIKIDVSLDMDEKKVTGEVETKIMPLIDNLNEFEVDAVAFKIESIKDRSGSDLKFEYDNKKILIHTNKIYGKGEEIIYTVNYNCIPQRGLYFIYPSGLNPYLPNQIWTQGEQEDNRHWIPIYDYPNDKTTFEIYVTVEKNFKTLSNGYYKDSEITGEGMKRRDHWVMDKPNSTYLIMIAAGEFNVVYEEFKDIPVMSYTDKNILPEDAKFSFRNTAKMVKTFSEMFQYNYPWIKYSQVVVEDFIFGGMENTSATVLNKRAICNSEYENDYSADGVISHELAHQWWGDLTTCSNWSEMWLNESFAEYSEALWKESYYDLNRDEYDYTILRLGDAAMRSDSITGRYPVWAGYGSVTANQYYKGAVILHTFRYILGDDFFPALNVYLIDNAYKNVETKDLINAMNKSYNARNGKSEDFKWMFDQWIWKAGHPEFDVKYDYDNTMKQVILNVRQIQKTDSLTPVFRMPLEVRLKNSNEDRVERIEITDEDEVFKLALNSAPDMVVFDHGNNILDKIFFDKPREDWEYQYRYSETAIDRIFALRGMEGILKEDESEVAGKPPINYDQIEVLKLLNDALTEDSFWAVRVEAAKILGRNFVIDRTSSVLKNAYDLQTNSRVKREILKALGNSDRSDDPEFIIMKIENDTNDYIIADGIGALGQCLPKENIYETVMPYLNRKSNREVIQFSVIDALSGADTSGTDAAVKEGIKTIAFGRDVEGRLRASAVTALKNYASQNDVKELAMKYADFNAMFVKRAMITLLGNSKDKSVIPFLEELSKKTTDESMCKLINASIKKLDTSN